MKNLVPLLVLCTIGIIIGIIATISNTKSFQYPSVTTNTNFDKITNYSTITSRNLVTPSKKEVVREKQYIKPLSLPKYESIYCWKNAIELNKVNSLLGDQKYREDWNNLTNISNPSRHTRYVTYRRNVDIATGAITIQRW